MVKCGSTRKHLKEEVSKEKVDKSTVRLGVQQREVAKDNSGLYVRLWTLRTENGGCINWLWKEIKVEKIHSSLGWLRLEVEMHKWVKKVCWEERGGSRGFHNIIWFSYVHIFSDINFLSRKLIYYIWNYIWQQHNKTVNSVFALPAQ